jgi:microcystin-dependent protein
MATPFLSEIRVFSFNFVPKGWALCNGQLLPINQNQALFSLLGTTYGGNGTTSFALPNLQGCCMLSAGGSPSGTTYDIGETGGESLHTLLISEMPQHSHSMQVSSASANLDSAVSALPAVTATIDAYGSPGATLTTLGSGSTATGGGQAHENRSPFLVLNLCIALTGIFPSRN